jgi:hypothetical protein
MGYITQTRVQDIRTMPWAKVAKNGVFDPIDYDNYGSGVYANTQTTTSYRTGKRLDGAADIVEDQIISSSSQGQLFDRLRDEENLDGHTKYDNGHTFNTVNKTKICTPEIDTSWTYLGNSYRYIGNAFTRGIDVPLGFNSAPTPNVNAAYYGPLAVERCNPTQPNADLAVGLAELQREGFPKPGSALREYIQHGKGPSSIPAVGSQEYLAYEFGLKPLLRDIQSFSDSVRNANSILYQYQRDSGKPIRRRYEFPIERSSTVHQEGLVGQNAQLTFIGGAPLTATIFGQAFNGNSASGKHFLTTTTTRRVWFSGAFTYYLDPGGSAYAEMKRTEQQINKLYGLRITPEVAWNLMPWSWLSDWNMNIGTNIANATALASDGLVYKYGYLMCETTVDYHSVVRTPGLKSGGFSTFNTIYRTVRKERVKASPFGFSLVPGSFTARQWTILGALGYTKAPGVLNTN